MQCLVQPTGYLDISKFGNESVYIKINFQNNKSLLFHVDITESVSFINPEHIQSKEQINYRHTTIKTILTVHVID